MKRPEQYELKAWLCKHSVIGLIVHHYQTGVDTSETDWELISQKGEKKRVKADTVEGLVNLRPDWCRVLRPRKEIMEEVEKYRGFVDRESEDLIEYERLKAKFEC